MQAGGRRFDSDPLHLVFLRRTKTLLIALAVVAGSIDPRAAAQVDACHLRETYRSTSVYSFDSMTVLSSEDVWATGESEHPVFAHWDGTVWSEIRGPRPSSGRFNLSAVDGHSPDAVWAVGTYVNRKGSGQALIMRWNGSEWGFEPIPAVRGESSLLDVVALEDGTAYAVGAVSRWPGNLEPLIFRYDGANWRREYETGAFGLSDVHGSGTQIWAVAPDRPFVLRRGLYGWRRFRSAKPNALLSDVAVNPEGSAWFVGESGYSHTPFAMRYRAGDWSRYPMPDRSFSEFLAAIAAPSDENVWVVGYRIYGDRAYPYAARRTPDGFVFVPAENPGWLAFRDVEVDELGGVWTAAEIGVGGSVEQGCR